MKQLLAWIAALFGGGKKKPPVVIVVPPPAEKPPPPIIVPDPPSWADRRPIGMLMLANWRPSAIAPNYRNWFLNGYYEYDDLKTALVQHAEASLINLKAIGAQAVIIWDIEGQKYPHSITYIGSPDKLPLFAPEMDLLADVLFGMFTASGLKTGVCLRPTVIKNLDTWPGQFNPASMLDCLSAKVAYAKKRWGCTLFYVDSNVGAEYPPDTDNTVGAGQVVPASVFDELAKLHPDCLFMPEHQDIDYHKSTAPYNDHNYGYKLDDVIKAKYPKAFMALNVADYNLTVEQAKETVAQGNILIGRVWYPARELELIKQAYENK